MIYQYYKINKKLVNNINNNNIIDIYYDKMIKYLFFISLFFYFIFNFDYYMNYFILLTYPLLFLEELNYYYKRCLLYLKNKILFEDL